MSYGTRSPYAFFQLQQALASGQSAKAGKWKEVLSGIETGDLRIGSRTPVLGMPVWATPEVVRGGFASGAYAAAGPLRRHEMELAEKIGHASTDASRLRNALNLWHLSDPGLEHLRILAETRSFEVDVPEETALLCVALVLAHDPERAKNVLESILPFFDRLRFFPRPTSRPRPPGISVYTVSHVRDRLAVCSPSESILTQDRTLNTWIPLYDALIDLIADPATENWADKARDWMKASAEAEQAGGPQRWTASESPFQRLKRVLKLKVQHAPVSAREQAFATLQISRHQARHGIGRVRDDWRAQQAAQRVTVLRDAMAKVLLTRLAHEADQGGLAEPNNYLSPVSQSEASATAPAGAVLPASLRRKVSSAKVGTIDALVESGLIRSPEMLGAALPQLTAEIQAKRFRDPAPRSVCAAMYISWYARRSLLLLDLQSQAKLGELPWAEALLSLADSPDAAQTVSAQTLRQLIILSLKHFPHVPFPNPLIEQMGDLAKTAGLTSLFTAEIAADIFMGAFAPGVEIAAGHSLSYHAGSLYARYYALPDSLREGGLIKLCEERAGQPAQGRSVAHNSMLLEHAMIATSHNLAAVFSLFEYHELDFATLAQSCFDYICHRMQAPSASWHDELITLKQSAYAWRQMIAFLSQLPTEQQLRVIGLIRIVFDGLNPAFRQRFEPAITALENCILIQSTPSPKDVFLGWTDGKHRFAKAPAGKKLSRGN